MHKVGPFLLCLIYSAPVFAASAVQDNGGTFIAPPNTTPSGTNGGTLIAPHIPPPPPPAPPSNSNINQGAYQGQAAEQGGSGANNAMGAALIAMGSMMMMKPPTVPPGIAMIAMGLLALAQGSHDDNAANQSGLTGATTDYANLGTTPGTTPTAETPQEALDNGLKSAFASAEGKKAIAAIKAAGGSVSSSGITMPDGTKVGWGALNSAEGMNAAGLDGKAIMAQANAAAKKLGLDKARVGGQALAEGASGAGSANAFGDGPDFKMPKFNNPFDLNAAQKAQLAAGKTLMRGGDPIGVAGDNLFAMIHRAYDRKTTAEDFIVNDAAPASVPVRAPASIGQPMRKSKR